MRMFRRCAAVVAASLLALPLLSQTPDAVRTAYVKHEYRIPMRDGVKLFTTVYQPRDTSRPYPILLNRTPYSVAPYGEEKYPASVGPSLLFQNEGYCFVYQDVRGRFMSEGRHELMTPYVEKKTGPKDVDETSDTYDTVEWLVRHLSHTTGTVGMWGISYPGYYAAMGCIDAHPAIKVVSPQAPMADVFIGDDFRHNGALFLPHAFGFLNVFRRERPGLEQTWRPGMVHLDTPDGYRYFLSLGSVANVNKRLFHDSLSLWNELVEHPTYDEYWKSRNVPRHISNIKPAVLLVGGLFDSEDIYGPFAIYDAIVRTNPAVRPTLVVGPWQHGGWARVDGDSLGLAYFGTKTSLWYRSTVELPFFNSILKNAPSPDLPAALVFLTGANEWRRYDQWPPKQSSEKALYLHSHGALSFVAPDDKTFEPSDEYVSDPAKPIPFTQQITTTMGTLFMVEDQRSVSTRPDVLTFETEPLTEDVTVVGRPLADLMVSTSGTDCDWIVKLIDVYPDTTADRPSMPWGTHLGGMQQLVRYQVMRSSFRNSLERPEAMTPGQVTSVRFPLPDVSHSFRRGHRIMVQIHSTWFPLIDRNPGVFCTIPQAADSDFRPTTQRVFHDRIHASRIVLRIIP